MRRCLPKHHKRRSNSLPSYMIGLNTKGSLEKLIRWVMLLQFYTVWKLKTEKVSLEEVPAPYNK